MDPIKQQLRALAAAKLKRRRRLMRTKPRKSRKPPSPTTKVRPTTAHRPVSIPRPQLPQSAVAEPVDAVDDEALTPEEAAMLAEPSGPSPLLIVGGLAVGAFVLYLVYRAASKK